MRQLAPFIIGAILFLGCSDDDEPGARSGGSAGGTKASGGSRATGGRSSAGSGAVAGTLTGIATGGIANGGASAGSGGATAIAAAAPGIGGMSADGGVSGAASDGGNIGTAGAPSGGSTGTAGAPSGGSVGTAGAGNAAGAPLGVAGALAGAAGEAPLGAAGTAGSGGATTVAGTAGVAGTAAPWVPNPGCGAVRESVVGWWSFEDTLTNRNELGQPLVAVPNTETPSFAAGIASGRALDVAAGSASEATDSAFNVTSSLTLSAFVKGAAPEGRIIDRITAGAGDGYLLDFYGGRLRMIVGSRSVESATTYSAFPEYTHVAAVFSGGASPEVRLFVNGTVAGQAAVDVGDIPANSLTLRIGADSNGSNRFSGQIDEPMVISRALSNEEILNLRNQLLAGQCPTPVAVSPANGLLLEHDASGVVQSGNIEHVRSNIRRAGDLRVLAGDSLYGCDWNGMAAPTVSGCQSWVPFATTLKTDGNFAPALPLEWRLFKFNTTGMLDQIGLRIETSGLVLHEQSSAPLAWFGRDWRVQRYAVASSGTALSGSLAALAQQLRDGAGFGAHAWGYSLPHFTATVPLSGDHFAGLDPWHISSDYGSIPGEVVFQSNSYHYAVWFDTTGYFYASRWYFGSPSSISDSGDTDATAYFTEPGWTEVLAHDATGAVTKGTKQALVSAIDAGATVRVGSSEGFYDCGRVHADAELTCYSHDTFTPVIPGNGHVYFDGTHSRRLRAFSTLGAVSKQDWSDHTANLVASSTETDALRWFVQGSGWSKVLQTNANGAVVSGAVANVASAIRGGAEVMVGRVGEGMERVRCESLRVATNPTRAACLTLLQFPGTTSGTVTPGYYEARVYNTNGVMARARVAFGSTDNSYEDAPTEALAWYVRRE